jgi:tetratricopeptide (TPR) repeat protein
VTPKQFENMSANDSPKARFRKAVSRVIVMSINRRLSKLSKPTLRLTWRLGVNLYGAEKYFDAYKQLSDVCSAIESKDSARLREVKVDFRDKFSFVYLMAARCCFKMFIQTEQHHHLENAYHKYERSIKTLTVDFLTAIRLPALLFEFSKVLENYGSFESALKTYGKILTAFPNFKGYFDVMYRSAIVGKFVSGKVQDPIKQQEMIRQCIDIVQFLLEAVPPTINEFHLVFLLCVTLEASSEASYRFQINDAFKMLHKLCKSMKPKMFSADDYRDYKEWMTSDPFLWYNAGVFFLRDNEVLLARDAFAMFMKRAAATDEKLSVDVLLTIAKNCARFQNYEEAVECADRALKVDHFHKETRTLLSQWSEIRRAELALEESSAAAIVKVWKGRLWQPGYRRRYAKIVVSDLEQTMSMSNTQYSAEVRNELAYFARDKWRARFLFEDECARRIQRTFRGAKLILSMARVGREKYRQLSNEVHAKILKKPFDPELRKEIYRIVAHKFCPKHHAIIGFAAAMREQEAAHAVIRKNVNIWRLKKRLHERHYAGLYREQLKRAYAAVDIQKIVRMKLAMRRTHAMKEVKARRHNAAKVIQRFVRHRNKSLRHSVTRMIERANWKKKKAANMVALFVIGKIKRRRGEKARIRLERNSAKKIQRMFRNW